MASWRRFVAALDGGDPARAQVAFEDFTRAAHTDDQARSTTSPRPSPSWWGYVPTATGSPAGPPPPEPVLGQAQWPRQRWIETIADRVDLDSVERACQRTHVHVAAEQVAPDGRSVVVMVNAAAREVVEVDVEDPGATARWERRYGIGAAAAMRVMAAVAASGGLGRADEVVATRSPITWSR